ncbi:MAG: ABC transporter ATP-binding protein [Thalassobaculales bacterium]
MLATAGLALGYAGGTVLRDLDCVFRPGEVSVLAGPNGAGKSTLLRALFGSHRPCAGAITLDGASFAPARRRDWQARFAYMPQDNQGRHGLTALEAVLLGVVDRLSFRPADGVLRQAAGMLDLLGLAAVAGRPLDALSGGQRQLVFFAQALMRRPRVLLLDEPVSALDLRHQHLVMEEVRRTARAQQAIVAVVLHDLALVARFADTVLLLHDGRLAAIGTPRAVLTAASLAAAYGVDARILDDGAGGAVVQVLGARPRPAR